jgi:hypothetical protein
MRKATLAVLLASLIGCITPRVHTRGSFVYFESGVTAADPKSISTSDIAAIEVFYKRDPARPFMEVGIVEAVAEGYGKNATLEDIFAELKKQAAVMRIQAIYKVELQRYDHAGDAMHATAVAIRYKE